MVLQGALLPNYVLHKDIKEGVSYTVPQGTEIEIYRKVRLILWSHDRHMQLTCLL